MPRKLKESDLNLFRKLWVEGKSRTEISRKLGISTWTVSVWRKKLGLPPRRKRMNPERRRRFIELYQVGETYREISEALGITVHTLRKWRKRLGLLPRWTPPSRSERLEREQRKLQLKSKLIALIDEKGAISVQEACCKLKAERNEINDLIKECREIEKLFLCFSRSAASKVIPSDIFGKYTAKRVIYNTKSLDRLKHFLVRIINENVKRELTQGEILALRYRFEKVMKLPREFVDDLLSLLIHSHR